MTSDDMIKYVSTVSEKKQANNKNPVRVSVGVIRNGKTTLTLYGDNGTVLPFVNHDYEIGSITKTVVGSILCKAISESLINFDSPLSDYIPLSPSSHNPTIEQIATHTAGYKRQYINKQILKNAFTNGMLNSFYAVSSSDIIKKAQSIQLSNKDYPFSYSNYGLALLGEVLATVYKKPFTEIANSFLKDDMELNDTYIADDSSKKGDLSRYWEWKIDNAYKSAGAIVSTITDMTKYIQLHMDSATSSLSYLASGHKSWTENNVVFNPRNMYGVHIDGVGSCWMIDKHNNLIWHNGATSYFNSYAAFNPNTHTAVVVLNNTSPYFRTSATAIGATLMNEIR